MVARTPLNVTFNVHCMSCIILYIYLGFEILLRGSPLLFHIPLFNISPYFSCSIESSSVTISVSVFIYLHEGSVRENGRTHK